MADPAGIQRGTAAPSAYQPHHVQSQRRSTPTAGGRFHLQPGSMTTPARGRPITSPTNNPTTRNHRSQVHADEADEALSDLGAIRKEILTNNDRHHKQIYAVRHQYDSLGAEMRQRESEALDARHEDRKTLAKVSQRVDSLTTSTNELAAAVGTLQRQGANAGTNYKRNGSKQTTTNYNSSVDEANTYVVANPKPRSLEQNSIRDENPTMSVQELSIQHRRDKQQWDQEREALVGRLAKLEQRLDGGDERSRRGSPVARHGDPYKQSRYQKPLLGEISPPPLPQPDYSNTADTRRRQREVASDRRELPVRQQDFGSGGAGDSPRGPTSAVSDVGGHTADRRAQPNEQRQIQPYRGAASRRDVAPYYTPSSTAANEDGRNVQAAAEDAVRKSIAAAAVHRVREGAAYHSPTRGDRQVQYQQRPRPGWEQEASFAY